MRIRVRSFSPLVIWFNKGCFGINVLKITFNHKNIYNSKSSCISLLSFSFINNTFTRILTFNCLHKEISFSFNKKKEKFNEEIEWV